jgi:hypothetical protein
MLKYLSLMLLKRFCDRCVKRDVIAKVTYHAKISFKISQGYRELQIRDGLDLILYSCETKTVDVLTKELH